MLKDKLFWFTTFEHQRFTIGVPDQSTQPSQGWQNAAKARPGEVRRAGQSGIGEHAQLRSGRRSATGDTCRRATVNNYTSTDPEYGYSYNGLAKVDYTINERNSLSAHWFVGQGNQVAPVGSSLKYYYEVAPIHVQNYAIVYNHVFSTYHYQPVAAGCQLLQPGLQRLR